MSINIICYGNIVLGSEEEDNDDDDLLLLLLLVPLLPHPNPMQNLFAISFPILSLSFFCLQQEDRRAVLYL